MKNFLGLYLAFLLLSSCASTYQMQPSNVATDNFVVLRKGYSGSGTRMKVFVDNKLVGKVGGYRYLSLLLPAGPHEVHFKFSPLVSRSAKRNFQISGDAKEVFVVEKGFLNYGVKILEGNALPAGISGKKKPKMQ